MTRAPAGAGLPIGVQVALLLLASLVAAEVMGLVVVFVSPPPRPPIYRLSEIAEALKGGPLQARMGRPMIRAAAAAPPAEPGRNHFQDDRARHALAALLQTPETRVRLIRPAPSLMAELSRGHSPMHRPPGDGPPPGFRSGPPPGAADGPGPGTPRPGEHWPSFGREGEIFGEFIAAVQQPGGRWTMLRPAPEAFPNDWQRRIALWFVGCLLIVVPIGYVFVRRITAPFDRFARAADALGRDPEAPAMALSGPAEIGKAASAFNDMQARIRRYVGDRTAMVGAISHDLRTPLARIRFKMEGADPVLKRAVMSDVDQMEQMIGAVLAFIRDASEPRRRERIDLLSLVECAADDAVLLGGHVDIGRGYPYAVEGDALALQRMLGNLVDNAVKYGGRAHISLAEADEEAVVEIEDDGPGLAESERERVFAPFYRTTAARTLDVGGVGLGLSVARSIARAHGGDVDLRSGARGLIARVRLPLAAG